MFQSEPTGYIDMNSLYACACVCVCVCGCVCTCVCFCALAWQRASSLSWLQSADCALWYGMHAGFGEPKRTEQPTTNLLGLLRPEEEKEEEEKEEEEGSFFATHSFLFDCFSPLLLPYTLSLENTQVSLFAFCSSHSVFVSPGLSSASHVPALSQVIVLTPPKCFSPCLCASDCVCVCVASRPSLSCSLSNWVCL